MSNQTRAWWAATVGLMGCILFAGSANAQNLPDRLGVGTPPPGTVATVDEAHALVINPAGLGYMEGPQLIVAHSGVDFVTPTGASDSIYGGLRLFGRFTMAAGADWIRPPRQLYTGVPTLSPGVPNISPLLGDSVLRLNAAVAFRILDEVSVGVAYRHLWGTSRRLYDFGTIDVGLSVRPLRYLAAGITLEQANSPFAGNQRMLRSIRMGLAVRPIWERITLSAETRIDERLRLDANLLGRLEVIPGVSIFLNAFWLDMLAGGGKAVGDAVSDRFRDLPVIGNDFRQVATNSVERVAVGAGFQFDLEHLGGGMLGTWSPGQGFLQPSGGVPNPLTGGFGTLGGLSVYGRASIEKYPSIIRLGYRNISLDVEGDLGAPSAINPIEAVVDLFLGDGGPGDLLALLEDARRDRRVKVVLLKIRPISAGWGLIVEVRRAVERLRASGKRVVAYLESGGDEEYHIASACDRIYLAPSGQLGLDGFNVVLQFVGAALDRIGVHAEGIAAGKYKSAPEQLTRSSPSPENTEVQEAILDGLYDVHVSTISRHRGIPPETVRSILDRGIISSEEAIAEKLVDGLAYRDELDVNVAKDLKMGSELSFNDRYGREERRFWRWDSPKAIAVVPLKGDIRQGSSSPTPGLFGAGGGAGADDIIEALEAAAEDDDVKAVVLRVDSPGGDSLASDLIWNAVARVRKVKPVIASFGDLAASGGYYAAAGADLILAEPTTLTGSIGVFTIHFEAKDLLDRFGVNFVEYNRGRFSAANFGRPLTEYEKEVIQKHVLVTYELFLKRVKDGRKLEDAKVREVAQGRVWTGAQAKEVGLVDEIGGLADAVQLAKDKVGLGGDDTVEIRIFTGRDDPVNRWGRALNVTMDMFSGERTRREQLRRATGLILGDPAAFDRLMLMQESRSLALMPYTVTVR